MATYTQFIQLAVATGGTNVTTFTKNVLPNIKNTSGETVNRKIVRVTGSLMFAANMVADRDLGAMFCLRAAPLGDAWPEVSSYDPFNAGPALGNESYQGRPSPRPFGRRMFALVTPAGGGVGVTEMQAFRYSSSAERLLRPGWELSMGLYVRGSHPDIACKVGGVLNVTVAG